MSLCDTMIWVPADYDDELKWHPDIPHDVPWRSRDGLPFDLTKQDGSRLTTLVSCYVPASRVAECGKRLAEKDVPEFDKRAVQMIRGHHTKDEAAPEFFASLSRAELSADEEAGLLMQARLRGLSMETAQQISRDRGLSNIEIVAPQRSRNADAQTVD